MLESFVNYNKCAACEVKEILQYCRSWVLLVSMLIKYLCNAKQIHIQHLCNTAVLHSGNSVSLATGLNIFQHQTSFSCCCCGVINT